MEGGIDMSSVSTRVSVLERILSDTTRPLLVGVAVGVALATAAGWCMPPQHPRGCTCMRECCSGVQSEAAEEANGQPRGISASAHSNAHHSACTNDVEPKPAKASHQPKLIVEPCASDVGFTLERGRVWEGRVCVAASAERASRTGEFEPRRVRRRVLCDDALQFLDTVGHGQIGGHVLTSLPCRDELSNDGLSEEEYRKWFTSTARTVLASCPADCFCVFYQSDEVTDGGEWLSKFAWVHGAAEQIGARLVWHKIVCIKAPDVQKPNRRPGYSWMACWSRDLSNSENMSQPDVLSSRGGMLWPKAMGRDAATLACRFIRKRMAKAARDDETSLTVVDPFAGLGTALATANLVGLHSFGVERSLKRCVSAAKETL